MHRTRRLRTGHAIIAGITMTVVVFATMAGAEDKFGRRQEVSPALSRAVGPAPATEDSIRRVYDVRNLGTFNGAVVGEDWQAELVSALRTTVDPASWDTAGGIGMIAPFEGALIVVQSPAAHDEIAAVLAGIRRARSAYATEHVDLRPIAAALDRPISVDLEDSLEGAVEQIGVAGRIEVSLDEAAIAAAGRSVQATVICRVDGEPVRTVLAELLEPLDLTWVERDERLLVTTSDAADEDRYPQVYDIRDLMDAGALEPLAPLVALTQTIVAPDSWQAGGATIAPIAGALIVRQGRRQHEEIAGLLTALREMQESPDAMNAAASPTVHLYRLPAPPDADEQPTTDLEALRSALMATIARPSWDQLGGSGSILVFRDLLVVRQSPAIQAEVADVIEQLVRIRSDSR
jgi:hypothetical protein